MNSVTLKDKTFKLYITAAQLNAVVCRIADEINRDVKDKMPIFLVTLNGAFMFAADLLKAVNTNCQVSFIKLSSYSGTISSGCAKELIGLNEDITGRTVVIIEDIIETGLTMRTMIDKLSKFKPADIKIATLIFKPQRLKENIKPDYVGLNIGDDFIVGYGLDYNGMGRNLADIYIISE